MKVFHIFVGLMLFVETECFSIRIKRNAAQEEEIELFEGDMAGFTPDTIEQLVRENNDAQHIYDPNGEEDDDSNVQHGAAIASLFAQWPGGKVFYTISSTYTQEQRKTIMDAMEEFHRLTCVKFIPRENQRDYIYIKQGLGCYSYVGRQGGRQILSLGLGCLRGKGEAVHELMHALGFFHEQSRWDRDTYIDVELENVDPNEKGNFKKYELDVLKNLNTPYDYASIMHYQSHAFSRNGRPTIIPKNPAPKLGQRDGLSPIDVKEIQTLYRCQGNPTSPNIDIIQRGVRLFNHYDCSHAISAQECVVKCKSASECSAMTYKADSTYEAGNCFLFRSDYRARSDGSMKWSSWIKHGIEVGVRLYNDFERYDVDNPVQCKDKCQHSAECKAMTFYAGETWGDGNCYLFRADYRIQVDAEMKWSTWRKQ